MITFYRSVFGCTILFGIAAQLLYNSRLGNNFNPAYFLSLFTVESIILGAILFLAMAFCALDDKKNLLFDHLRGAVTLSVVLTGIIYIFLPGVDVLPPNFLLTAILHYIFPALVLLDWLIDKPSSRIPIKQSLWWLGFPLLYVIYILFRGASIDWYPYAFINVRDHGYGAVTLNCLLLAGLVAGLALLINRLPYLITHQKTAKSSHKHKKLLHS